MPLHGLRVLDLTDFAGALCPRLLSDLGADVVRIEPPAGTTLRRLPTAHAYYDLGKRSVVVDVATSAGRHEIAALAAAADVIVDAPPLSSFDAARLTPAELRAASPDAVLVRITPFGAAGPRAGWHGSDLVCAARGGIVYINGFPDSAPIAPFGLQAYNAAGVVGAIGALCALRARGILHVARDADNNENGAQSGVGIDVDVSIAAAATGALEHVTGLHRQNGTIEPRRGTLHWSRSFRIARCRDGYFLLAILGDWTSLVEWAVSEGADPSLRDERWTDSDLRRERCEEVFDHLDRFAAGLTVAELSEGARLRRLPLAPVLTPAAMACGEHLAARGWPASGLVADAPRRAAGSGASSTQPDPTPLPGGFCHLSRTPIQRRRGVPALGEHDDEVRADAAWRPFSAVATTAASRVSREARDTRLAEHDERIVAAARGDDGTHTDRRGARILDGIRVLDFTWVVAGPVATRFLADQGAEVIKIEPRGAPDFGTRRGGLTGNLNRGKQSLVIDMRDSRGVDLARRLVAQSDVVIENFSARVMGNWGLDDAELERLRPNVIVVHMSGFGRTGPWRDQVSYGPTLQALAGFPHLMRLPGEPPAGWGYSYSDMISAMLAALATLAALEHRQRTGLGQVIDLGQLECLMSVLGPRLIDALAGREIDSPGNRSQEGDATPHGIYRCAPDVNAEGRRDDDRWIAIAVLDDAAWRRFAALLADDGETWAAEPDLHTVSERLVAREQIDRRLGLWTKARRAEEIEERLQAIGVAAGVVANAADLARDPQLAARGYFPCLTTAEGAIETFDGVPFLCSHLGGRVAGPGPLLGEHTDAVLTRALGIDPDTLAILRSEGVIA